MAPENRGTKNDPKWYCSFTFKFPDGTTLRVRERSPVNTKTGADDYERAKRKALLAAGPNPPKTIPTLAEFWPAFETFSKNNNKASTVYSKEYVYRLHLKPFFGSLRLDEITTELVEEFKAEMRDEKELELGTVNNLLGILRAALNLAVEYTNTTGYSNPPEIKAFRKEEADFEFLDFEETGRFLAAVPEEWLTMATLLLKTGLRIGECLALRWTDLDLKAGRLIVKHTAWKDQEHAPKSGKRREIPLSAATCALLQSYRHLKGPYVFCQEDGSRLTMGRIKNVIPNAAKKAGLAKRLTNHSLRHSFASHLVMRGRSLLEVQQLLGHATIAMTMRYAHLAPDIKRAAIEALDSPVEQRKEVAQ